MALPGAAAVFAAWEDGGCAVWSLPEGERLQSFCAPPDLHPEDSVRGPLNRALFDPEGHHFLATHMDQHLHLGDLTEGQWRGHWEAQAPITAFARAPFGLLVGDMDGHVSATTCRLL